jgi:hypothetical protein
MHKQPSISPMPTAFHTAGLTSDQLSTVCLTPCLFQSAVMGLFHLGSVEEPGALLMPQSIQSQLSGISPWRSPAR